MDTADAFKGFGRFTGNFNPCNELDGVLRNVILDFFDTGNGIMVGEGNSLEASILCQRQYF